MSLQELFGLTPAWMKIYEWDGTQWRVEIFLNTHNVIINYLSSMRPPTSGSEHQMARSAEALIGWMISWCSSDGQQARKQQQPVSDGGKSRCTAGTGHQN